MVRDKEIIQETLQKLVESDVFLPSEVNVFILKFLVQSYLNNDNVKETIIELALGENLKTGQSFEGKVRVYMFNLRKKLDEYYATTGANDELIFQIKKGQYNLSVIKNPNVSKTTVSRRNLLKPLYVIPFFLLIAISAYWVSSNDKESYCWHSFFEEEANTICYVGDHFATLGEIDGHMASVYFQGVNSKEDLDSLAESALVNSANFKPREYSFVSKMGPVCSAKLAAWFSKNESDMDVRMESDFVKDDLVSHNVIYIGPFKTFSHLDLIFLKKSAQFGLKDRGLYDFKNKISLKCPKDQISPEYVMVSYHEITDQGRKILFFAGDHDIGVMATVSNFTNKEWLENFYLDLPSPNAQFNALFRVKGIGRTNTECELVELELLD